MNFPTRHPLNQSNRGPALVGSADVILSLEVTDLWGTLNSFREQLHRSSELLNKPGAKGISIAAWDQLSKSNYQDFQRYTEGRYRDGRRRRSYASSSHRSSQAPYHAPSASVSLTNVARGSQAARIKALDQARTEATYAWDASPISYRSSVRRSVGQNQRQRLDTCLGDHALGQPTWPMRLWDFDKHHQSIGGAGGHGIGYGAPASLGAALANKKHGRLTVSIQCDGDLMYAPGILWTSAHHKIPLLSIMHNNRGYHQELMHIQRMSDRHNRGITRANIGTTIVGPDIDYAKLAQAWACTAKALSRTRTNWASYPARHRHRRVRRASSGRCSNATALRSWKGRGV